MPQQTTASGGTAPYTYSGASLPAGVTVDPATGQISGTPTTAGAGTATMTVTDAAGGTATCDFDWTVGGATDLTPVCTNPGNQTSPEDAAIAPLQIVASGGDGTLSYAATGLPAGLTIDSATGMISGTPTDAGTSSVTVTVTDADGDTCEAVFSWEVLADTTPPPPPTNLVVTHDPAGPTNTLTWTAPADMSDVAKYQWRSPSSGGWVDVSGWTAGNDPLATTMTFTGLTTDQYQVRSVDAAGNASVETPWVTPV